MASFEEIKRKLRYPDGVSARYKTLDALDRLLDGTLYDELPHPFDREYEDGFRYVPLEERRPSVVYGLPRIIADECSSLTFGEGHAPSVRCGSDDAGDEASEAAIAEIIQMADVWSVMLQAVHLGSVGSVAAVVRALDDGTPYISLVKGKYARPIFDPRNPRRLMGLVQQYPVTATQLQQRGYDVPGGDNDSFWFRSEIDDKQETQYRPLPNDAFQKIGDKNSGARWVPDRERSGAHRFGVTPVVWMRNGAADDVIDGPATFAPIVHLVVKMDYLLSQIARGVRFSADPLLVIKSGEMLSLAAADGAGASIVRDPSSALELPAGADAKLLETTGKAIEGGREFVRLLREYALEVVGGMRSSADQATGPQSGRALEILHQALVWLVERMRLAYGDRGLVPLLRLLLIGVKRGALEFEGVNPATLSPDVAMRLVWPSWWTPRGADLQAQATALQTLAGGSMKSPVPLLPIATVARLAATDLGLANPTSEVNELQAQTDAQRQAADDVPGTPPTAPRKDAE